MSGQNDAVKPLQADDFYMRLQTIHFEWQRLMQEYSASWLEMSRLVYILASTDAFTEDGEPCKLWQLSGADSWSAFSLDFLSVPPPASSQMRGIWEVFAVQLRWPRERMLAVGKSKLAAGLAAMRAAVESGDDGRVEELSEWLETKTYAELLDLLAAARGGGTVVRFALQHGDFGAPPDLYESDVVQSIVLDAELDGHVQGGAVVVLIRNVDPSDASAIVRRLQRSLRWREIGRENAPTGD